VAFGDKNYVRRVFSGLEGERLHSWPCLSVTARLKNELLQVHTALHTRTDIEQPNARAP
jgi:hypothetical protein